MEKIVQGHLKAASSATVRMLVAALLVLLGYYLAAHLGVLFIGSDVEAAVFWPPNSIILAALLLSPQRHWWAFGLAAALGDLAFDFSQGDALVTAVGFAVANLTEVFLAATLIRRLLPARIDLTQIRHATTFVAIAALVSPAVSAFIGVAALSTVGPVDYWTQWRQWWLGDAIAHLTLTPALIIWLMNGKEWIRSLNLRRSLGIVVVLATLIANFLFLQSHFATPLTALVELYFVLTFVSLLSAWAGPLEATASSALVTMVAGWLTLTGTGPFAGLRQAQSVANMQVFLAVLAVSSLLVMGLIKQHRLAAARFENLSITDQLTGAFNRRYLLDHVAIEMERAKRFKRELAFLFLDLDHFKRVNDRFGHLTGDLVLSTFSQLCRKVLRPSDILVRYGGEEFVIVLPETGLEGAVSVARRILQQTRETVFSTSPRVQGLTVSIGVSARREDGDTFDAILTRIDKATYRAKQLGRDRIEVARAAEVASLPTAVKTSQPPDGLPATVPTATVKPS